MTTWLMITGMALITFANRFLFLSKAVGFSPQPNFKIFLSYSAYAVLTAIWAPIVFGFDGSKWSYAGLDYLLATSVAAILTLLRFSSILVVVLSIGLFALLRITL